MGQAISNLFFHFEKWSEQDLSFRLCESGDAVYFADMFDQPLQAGTAELMAERLQALYRSKRGIHLAVEKSNGTFAGIVDLYDFRGNSCEIGYRIRRSCRRQGIATKAAGAVLAKLREYQVKEVRARCEEKNTASAHVLENNHFHCIDQRNHILYYEVKL